MIVIDDSIGLKGATVMAVRKEDVPGEWIFWVFVSVLIRVPQKEMCGSGMDNDSSVLYCVWDLLKRKRIMDWRPPELVSISIVHRQGDDTWML